MLPNNNDNLFYFLIIYPITITGFRILLQNLLLIKYAIKYDPMPSMMLKVLKSTQLKNPPDMTIIYDMNNDPRVSKTKILNIEKCFTTKSVIL